MKQNHKLWEWIFTILSILATLFSIFWFVLIIFYTKQESNLGTGLSIAVGIIFQVIGSIIGVLFSIVGIVFYFIVKKKIKEKQNKGLLFTNIITSLINILLFIILLLIV